MVYTSEQKAFLLESYFRNGQKVNGVWKYSIQPCLEEFREAFPEVVIVYEEFKNTLHRNVNLFRGTASTSRKEGSGRPTERTEEVIHATQEILEQDPKTSIRHLSQQVELSVGTCHELLRKDLHVYPYRLQSVQELQPVDFPRRLQYCQWFLDNIANNNELLEKTFFTDEAWIHLSGYTNSQNMRIWATQHPHEVVEEPLHTEKIGVWAAISKRRIVGPIFFQGTLTAVRIAKKSTLLSKNFTMMNTRRHVKIALLYTLIISILIRRLAHQLTNKGMSPIENVVPNLVDNSTNRDVELRKQDRSRDLFGVQLEVTSLLLEAERRKLSVLQKELQVALEEGGSIKAKEHQKQELLVAIT
nr:PREDICTED: uncharacterized protein LOC107397488 [Tribolium castaneum]|eukprot:XP_015833260.1 PREDICTED: uncharacterized protein LOC107397488 [Tribolium castaneum]